VKACFLFTITPQFPIVSKLFCNGIFDIIKYFDAPSFLVAPLLVVAPRKLLMSLVSLSCFSHKRGSFSCIYWMVVLIYFYNFFFIPISCSVGFPTCSLSLKGIEFYGSLFLMLTIITMLTTSSLFVSMVKVFSLKIYCVAWIWR
jgi:hypothetical protein